MPVAKYKNVWGTRATDGNSYDLQRSDLFELHINLPEVLGGVANWDNTIKMTVTKFPFPARERSMIEVKYLNQTNFILGAENALGTIEIPVRYAFENETAVLLEKWHWMTSDPNGGVGRTSSMKTTGVFNWLVPSLTPKLGVLESNLRETDADTVWEMKPGGKYFLEGILVKNLSPTEANMDSRDQLVMLNLTLSVDRYFPARASDLKA